MFNEKTFDTISLLSEISSGKVNLPKFWLILYTFNWSQEKIVVALDTGNDC